MSARLPVHSFVNDLDVVPRVLQHSKVASIMSAVQHKVARQTGGAGIETSKYGSFASLGSTYLLLNDSIKVFDSQLEQGHLCQTVNQAYQVATGAKLHIQCRGIHGQALTRTGHPGAASTAEAVCRVSLHAHLRAPSASAVCCRL